MITQYYRSVSPSLVGFPMPRRIMIGMHCRGEHDIRYLKQSKAPANVVEVKPEKFAEQTALFQYDKGEFRANQDNLKWLKRELGTNFDIQFHFPPEELCGRSLNPGIEEDHPDIISLFRAIAELTQGPVTMHPPTIMFNGQQRIYVLDADKALYNTKRLFDKLDGLNIPRLWVGLENQADPKKDSHVLGYMPNHFRIIMTNSPVWLHFTIDSGHRLLCRNLSVTQIVAMAFELGKRVINFHFHENPGIQTDSYKDDWHGLPLLDYIHGDLNYLNRAVQEGIPIIIEVNTRRHRLESFRLIVAGIRWTMEAIAKEEKELQKKGLLL